MKGGKSRDKAELPAISQFDDEEPEIAAGEDLEEGSPVKAESPEDQEEDYDNEAIDELTSILG
ncbi:MAG TPA: hypothetical protein VLA15_09305, partial [Desulfurivibrionaceae bacterium]|nr:hypothetical protein [Desulfurivibrionaceae bacterium]